MKIGGAVGCLTAALIGIVIMFPLFFALAWSGAHCDPVPQCQRANELHFGALIAGGFAVAAGAGFGVRYFVNKLASQREDEGTSPTFIIASTGTAIALAVLTSMAMIYL